MTSFVVTMVHATFFGLHILALHESGSHSGSEDQHPPLCFISYAQLHSDDGMGCMGVGTSHIHE